jgi:hypothetical protein
VRSKSATGLATSFYKYLLKGETFGHALRKARRETAGSHGPRDLTWAAYTLYGDPRLRLLPSRDDEVRRGRARWLAGIIGLLILLVLILVPVKTHREDFGSRYQAVGYLLLESTPDGARIFVDGEQIGVTPFAVEIDIGSHRVSIEKQGYKRWEAWVEVRQSPRTVVQAHLDRVE